MGDRPLVLTIEETARALRIGRTAAYEAARRGEIPVVPIGRRRLVPRHKLAEMLGIHPDSLTDERPAATPDAREDRLDGADNGAH